MLKLVSSLAALLTNTMVSLVVGTFLILDVLISLIL